MNTNDHSKRPFSISERYANARSRERDSGVASIGPARNFIDSVSQTRLKHLRSNTAIRWLTAERRLRLGSEK